MDKFYYLKNGFQKHSHKIVLNKQIGEESEQEKNFEEYKAGLRKYEDSVGHSFNDHNCSLEDADLKEWSGL